MSYTKTTWQDGDIITTEKLNKIENGIEQASSGGSGGARIINLATLEYREEADPEDDETVICYFSGYEAGLSAKDFVNAWLELVGDRLMPVLSIRCPDDLIYLLFEESVEPNPELTYKPETGEFYYLIDASSGGGHSAK